MYFRHRLKCEACGVETAEAQFHFEDPSQPLEEAACAPDFQPPHPATPITLNFLYSMACLLTGSRCQKDYNDSSPAYAPNRS
jgi:hypothetical protein